MAEIKNVILQVEAGSSPSTRKAKVDFTVSFNAEDAGKSFQYGISLRGQDKTGDDEASFLTNGQSLFTFMFKGILQPAASKGITAQMGDQSFSEAREVPVATLNEDPGMWTKVIDPNTTIQIPHPDEVFATVSLIADTESSPTVTLFL